MEKAAHLSRGEPTGFLLFREASCQALQEIECSYRSLGKEGDYEMVAVVRFAAQGAKGLGRGIAIPPRAQPRSQATTPPILKKGWVDVTPALVNQETLGASSMGT